MDTLIVLSLQLSAVTVYPMGGKYTYTGLLSAERGYNYFIWPALPPQADPTSVRVILPPTAKGCVTQSAVEPLGLSFRHLPPDLTQLKQKIDSLEEAIAKLRQRLLLLTAQESTLVSNIRLGGEEGPTRSEEVEKYLLLLERRLPRLLEEKHFIQKRLRLSQDTLYHWKSVYQARLKGVEESGGVLLFTYWTTQKEVLPFHVELIGPQAGWQLSYRIRAFPAQGQVRIQRWASVQNLSGEDWKNVNLTLSSAQPRNIGEMPPFSPWYVDIEDIKPLSAPIVGYSAEGSRLDRFEEKADGRGGEDSGEANTEKETFSLPLSTIQEQAVSRTYELGTQTVPAGKRSTQFLLKEDTVIATFQFFLNAPLASHAYLRGGVSLEVLSLWETAPAIIEVEGQEVAHITWPPFLEGDTLWIDMGPTERIIVRRTETLNRKDTRPTGSSVYHHFAYSLQVSHTYPTPIQLTIWDRVPVSRTSEIKVELEESGGAVHNPQNGQLRWDVTLQPGQKWERAFRFTMKYPRQKVIIGL
ncbi:MAG: DUF4139 domain-containing protein [Bacteroidia bacterium]|nr:DUF4139 domain-containing protein [Bacteroidia bacterium]MDW8133898.1 DUF4139 domain-containing protein [Bacteroidia bacterium]